jgi:aminotransferase
MIGYMNDLVYVCAPAPLQYGVAVGLDELGEDFYRSLIAEYTRKRDRICRTLAQVGLPPSIPEGAYYVLADVSRLPGATSKEKAMHLLKNTGVASVPGEAFYHELDGANLVRFCFAKRDEELEEACHRLERLA